MLLAVLLFSSLSLHATEYDEDERPKTFGAHHGYVSDVADERSKRDVEMVMLEKRKDEPPPLSERIFNEKLSKEFVFQYQYRFGQTAIEQSINNPSRSDGYMQTSLRPETAEEARVLDDRILEVWSGHPRRHVIDSDENFLRKLERLLALVRAEIPACCR